MASSARLTARNLHLARAARSAGEAFAHASPDDQGGAPATTRGAGLAWLSLGFVALGALYYAF